jgi:membrane-bound serine protease (ClpP class)
MFSGGQDAVESSVFPPRTGATRRRLAALVLLTIGLVLSFLPASAAQTAPPGKIDLVTINGTITDVTHDYVKRAFDKAKDDGAQAILIQLSSGGGNAAASDDIITLISSGTLPVIVYVPSGDTIAGSAVTILASAQIAAMAPDASIGDASRVAAGDAKTLSDQQTEQELAQFSDERGRATQWSTGATQDGYRISGTQALQEKIVNFTAPDRATLIAEFNGKTVRTGTGATVTLTTSSGGTVAATNTISMTTLERIRAFVTSPSVAYVLLCFGVLGIFMELASPGGFVAGTIGLICSIAAIYAFSQLPVDWAGIALMLLAFVLLGIDLFVTSFGVLTVTGLAAFIAGSYILIDTDIVGYDHVSRPVIWTGTACVIAFAAFIGYTGIGTLKRKPVTGRKSMIGEVGVVRQALKPRGMIFVYGELWQAQVVGLDDGVEIPAGTHVEIVAINGLLLDVQPTTAPITRSNDTGNEPRNESVIPVRDGVEGSRP